MPTTAPKPANDARDALLDRLYALFRTGGFEAVSIGDVSRETGLGKSSLYHYFPGGKDDMALAVAERAAARVRALVIAPLAEPVGRAERIGAMIAAVDALYAGGEAPCLIAAMTLSDAPAATRACLAALLRDWLAALAEALVATGAAPDAAEARAFAAVSRIEGALMIARALDDRARFVAELARIEADLRRD